MPPTTHRFPISHRALIGALLALACTSAPATAAGVAVRAKQDGRVADAPAPRAPREPLVIQALDWRGFGLVLQTSAPVVPDVFSLNAPARFVVDLPACEFADPALSRTIPVGKDGIRQIRMAQQASGVVRLVFDCDDDAAEPPTFQVMQLGDKSTLVVARTGQQNAALAAMIRAAAAEIAGGPPGAPPQVLDGVWAKEIGDRLILHLGGIGGREALRYILFQEAPDRMKIRVPSGKYQGAPPKAGRLLARADVKTGADGWTLDLDLLDGHYELAETRDAAGGVTLSWDRVEPRTRPGRPLIVIDPGHGGADPGAVGPGGKLEKEVCLSLGRSLRDALRRRGFNAILTRGADAEVHLAPRLALVDRWKADLFVSLHANSHTTPDAIGLETYWREPASQAFAETVHRAVATLLRRPDRGTKQERLYVLRHPRVPSLLLESAFISNPNEERLLDDGEFQAQTAFAVALGIEQYLSQPSLGKSPKTPPSLLVSVP